MSEEAEQAKQSAFPAPPPYWQLSGLEPPPVPHRDDSSQGRYFSFGALLQADTFEPTLDDGLEKLLPLREDGSVDFAAEKLDPSVPFDFCAELWSVDVDLEVCEKQEKLRTWNRQNLRDFAKLLRVLVRPLKQPSQVSVESSEQQTSLGLSDVQDEDHLEMRRLLRVVIPSTELHLGKRMHTDRRQSKHASVIHSCC
ncbi:MAG: hypothetical protein MHM6MM_002757 [Cercozoa sp. M6MM]